MSDFYDSNRNRNSSRVSHAPGGASSISFGSGEPPKTPTKPVAEPTIAEAPAEIPAPDELAPAPAPPASEPVEDLEVMKMKAVAMITKVSKDSPAAREALETLMKSLTVAKAITEPGTINADEALAKLQAVLKGRGSHGIVGLGRRFKIMDDNNDKRLSLEEFRNGLNEISAGLSEADIHRLFRSFDFDCNGYLTFNELLVGLRGELNPRRLEMVKLAFNVLDKTGDGEITMADLEGRYDASKHPDVVCGTKDPKEVLLEFLGTFEAYGGGEVGDGLVTFTEFCQYYGAVSANVDDDDYFELMIRNAWHISGGEGWCENTTCKRVLIVQEDGTQSVVELTDDFDVDVKDIEAVKAKLRSQGVTFKNVAVYGSDVSSITLGEPSSPAPAAGSSSLTPGATPSFGDNKRHNMRSSIMFG
eukprot:gene4895-34661_t